MRPDALSPSEIGLLIFGMALVTLLTRAFFVFLGERVRVPEIIIRAIRYAPLAAIVGIVMPELLLPAGVSEISQINWQSPNIWGGVAGFLAYFWTRQMLPTLILGMAVFSLIRYWL
jgi:branched-subunit amino acid transport protein